MNRMHFLFNPKTVAVIGASRHPRKVGHVIFRNFLEGSFRGEVFPVNPDTKTLLGKKCYSTVLAIKKRIDLAVIAVPAAIVPGVMKECGKKGIPAAIIVTGGFREIGNTELERKVEKTIKKYKIKTIGVNCLGIFDPYSGVDTLFLPSYKLERPGKGSIAFITQSGAIGSVILDWMAMKGYNISKFISYGNATGIDEAELIDFLSKDKKTKVICVYLEGVKHGRRFYEAAKKCSKRKPIIILKGGLTKEGNKAVSSHTGSLAGTKEIYEAVFRQTGSIMARDIEQVFDFARILSTQPLPKGNRVQIITDGGGFGILTVDNIIRNGLELAEMNKDSQNFLKNHVPKYVVVKNPIDLTGDATTERYKMALDTALRDKNVDMVAVIILFQVPTLTPDIVEVINEANSKKRKPIVVIAAGGRYTETLKKSLEGYGIPCFSYPERAAESLNALYQYSRRKTG